MLWEGIFILVASTFCGLTLWFYYHFSQRNQAVLRPIESTLNILITFKNNSENLVQLIAQFSDTARDNNLQIHLADDHSDTITKRKLESLTLPSYCNWLHPPHAIRGKKLVQKWAMQFIESPFCLLLDVDSVPPSFIRNGYVPSRLSAIKLMLIPVQPIQRNGFWNAFFDLDFLSLQLATVASAQGGKPLLANGACMIVDVSAYQAVAKIRDDWDYSHGDDVFLLHAMVQEFGGKAIACIHPSHGFARSSFPMRLSDLYFQRLRWIGKVGRVRRTFFQFVAWIVLIGQFSILSSLLMGFGGIIPIKVAFFVCLVMAASSGCLLLRASFSFNRKDLQIYILPALIIYPIYLISLAVMATVYRPKWKV